jgi:hypothetical protein
MRGACAPICATLWHAPREDQTLSTSSMGHSRIICTPSRRVSPSGHVSGPCPMGYYGDLSFGQSTSSEDGLSMASKGEPAKVTSGRHVLWAPQHVSRQKANLHHVVHLIISQTACRVDRTSFAPSLPLRMSIVDTIIMCHSALPHLSRSWRPTCYIVIYPRANFVRLSASLRVTVGLFLVSEIARRQSLNLPCVSTNAHSMPRCGTLSQSRV